MKKTKLISIISVTLVFAMLLCGNTFVINAATTSDDPSDSYTVITAPYEDSTIDMWFDYPTHKVRQCDHTDTNLDTFSVYLAKNEIEGTQVILYPSEDKSNLTASVSDFTGMETANSGSTLSATLYKEKYVTYSVDNEKWPDAIPTLDEGESFDISSGCTQALLINLTSKTDTVAGWYSGTFNLKNSSGQIVKTATIYAKVWNYALSEETPVQTSFYLGKTELNYYLDTGLTVDEEYKEYYDYLLENRVCATNLPYELLASPDSATSAVSSSWSNSSEIPAYLNNPRVTAFRIGKYAYNTEYSTRQIKVIYAKMKTNSSWMAKHYFYNCDEPLSYDQQTAGTGKIAIAQKQTLKYVIDNFADVKKAFGTTSANVVIPFHENFQKTFQYDTTNANAYNSDEIDAAQVLFENSNIYCGQINTFTSTDVVNNLLSQGIYSRNVNGILSQDQNSSLATSTSGYWTQYYNWEEKYGEYSDRVTNAIATKPSGQDTTVSWWYVSGQNQGTTTPNFALKDGGVKNRMTVFMMRKYGVTGLLYYYANLWNSTDAYNNIINSVDGNGILVYPGVSLGKTGAVGSLRLDGIRDGIEDYMSLDMYADIYGETAAQKMLSNVATNVAQYTTDDAEYSANRIAIGEAVSNPVIVSSYNVTLAKGTGAGEYAVGDTVTVTASPDNGYEFVSWNSVDGVSYANINSATTTFTMPDHDVTLTYTVKAASYDLTVTNGTGSGSYDYGSTVSISATVADGYSFVSWDTIDGVTYADPSSQSTTITMPSADTTITYTVKEIPKYDVTISNGTLSGSGTSTGSFAGGTSVSASATVDEDHFFAHWNVTSPDGLSILPDSKTSTISFTMPESAVSLEAVNVLKGDVNLDGSVNAKDVLMIRKYLTASENPSDDGIIAADVYGHSTSNTINAQDLLYLRKMLVNLV